MTSTRIKEEHVSYLMVKSTKEITKAEDIMNLNFSEEEVDKELDKYTDWEQLDMYNLQ